MSRRLLPLAGLLLLTLGCEQVRDGLSGGLDHEAEAAVDALQDGSLETALLVAMTSQVTISGDEDAMADDAAALAASVFAPSTCVQTARLTEGTVGYTLEDCDGPYGLRGITGAANLLFAVAGGGGTAVNLTAGGMEVNGALVGVNVGGGMSTNDQGQRAYELVTSGGGATRAGEAVTRAGSFVARVVDGCVRMEGGWTATVDFDLRAASFTGLTRCDAPCPSSGTAVWTLSDVGAIADGDADALTFTFLGASTIGWVTTSGRVGTVELACGV